MTRRISVPVKVLAKTLSVEGDCLASSNNKGLFPAGRNPDAKKKWLSTHTLWMTKSSPRVFTPVHVGGRFYWSDVVTGSLYNCSGACQSSDKLSISVKDMHLAGEDGVNILKAARSTEAYI